MSNPSHLKGILILGCNIHASKHAKDLYNKEGYITVGDGYDTLTVSSISSQLQGKLGAGTRIDVNAHGSLLNGDHHLEFDGDKVTPTKDFLSSLKKIAGENTPLEVHLWSCYGGKAADYASELPRGSVFIAHAPDDSGVLAEIDNFSFHNSILKYQESKEDHSCKLDMRQIFNNMINGLGQQASFAISDGTDMVETIKFSLPCSDLASIEAINAALREFYNNCFSETKKLKDNIADIDKYIIFPEQVELDFNPSQVQESVKEIQTCYFIFKAKYGNGDFYNFLVENEEFAVEMMKEKNKPYSALTAAIGNSNNNVFKMCWEAAAQAKMLPTQRELIDVESSDPLSMLIFHGNPERIVDFIRLAKDASIDIKTVFTEWMKKAESTVLNLLAEIGNDDFEVIIKELGFTDEELKLQLLTPDSTGDTPLPLAIRELNLNMALYIMQLAKNASLPREEIQKLILNTDSSENSALKYGAYIEETKILETMLELARDAGILTEVLESKIDTQGSSIFHFAAAVNNSKTLKLLLEYALNQQISLIEILSYVDENGNTLLHTAFLKESIDCATELVSLAKNDPEISEEILWYQKNNEGIITSDLAWELSKDALKTPLESKDEIATASETNNIDDFIISEVCAEATNDISTSLSGDTPDC